MRRLLKKFWHWLRCEDEDGNPVPEPNTFGPDDHPFVYSEMMKKYPIHGKVGDDDIMQLSHRLDGGGYETCYVTVGQLKECMRGAQ